MVKKGERKTIQEPFMCYINELLCEFAVQVFDISRECGATAVKVQVSICCTLKYVYQVPRKYSTYTYIELTKGRITMTIRTRE